MSTSGRRPRNPATTPPWRHLRQHYKHIAGMHLRDLFAGDPARAEKFALEACGLYVDYSKHRVTAETMTLLLDLAGHMGVNRSIQELFEGARVNVTEHRSALHTALRTPPTDIAPPEGMAVARLVRQELARIEEFVALLERRAVSGWSGRPMDTLVNIGIGGSDLGPRLVTDAFTSTHPGQLRVYFAANADPEDLLQVLVHCNPETTLFLISSKSFTTAETLTNAGLAREWLRDRGCGDPGAHFIAATANGDAAAQYGIAAERTFHFWDWVGGRYSLWSAAGLAAAAAIGMDNFRALLAGAHAMDVHFRTAPPAHNLPVLLALLDIWSVNFLGCETLAVIPYVHNLKLLPRYLAQLFMESNGKSVRRDNGAVRYVTGAIIWGGEGTNAQHAFMQLLHQGTHTAPVEFLAAARGAGTQQEQEQHRLLLANCIAQSKALMLGNDPLQVPGPDVARLVPGNRPSTTILFDRLTPATLGALLAMYEHRVYVQSCLWNINAFDQWGVELGKQLAAGITDELRCGSPNPAHDSSTRSLIRRCRKNN